MRRGALTNSQRPTTNWAWWAFFLVPATLVLAGCTRHYFRERADADVEKLLTDKSSDDRWPLINYWVYPHPLARFADLDQPDCPAMPPDDPAAWITAPKPQKPSKVGYTEGTGYLDLLAQYDAINRAKPSVILEEQKEAEPKKKEPEPARKPFLITLEQALELAIINSKEIQAQREILYLTALPVTTERFNFLPQFLATQEAIRQWSAQESNFGPTNQWELNSVGGVSQQFFTGASLLLRLANQTVIDVSSMNKPTISTSSLVLDFSQPLLRGGGQAVALEPLTQSERDLLYEVRRYARFNKEFFVQLAGGPGIGAPGGPANLVATSATLNVSNPGTVRAAAAAVGYLPTVQRKLNIDLQQRNVDDLVELLQFYREFAKGGGLSPLQVDQVEQQLLDARTALLSQEVAYFDSIEQFKIQLGLPTDLPLDLNDEVLSDLRDQLFRFQKLELNARKIVETFTKLEHKEDGQGSLRQQMLNLIKTSPLTAGTEFAKQFPDRLQRWRVLNSSRIEPSRMTANLLGILGQLPGLNAGAALSAVAQTTTPPLVHQLMLRNSLIDEKDDLIDLEKPVPAELDERILIARREFEIGAMDELLTLYRSKPWLAEANERLRQASQDALFRQIEGRFSLVIDEARSERQREYDKKWPALPPVLLHGQDLLRMSLEEAQDLVGQTALENRLDLMNQQALLADSWRKIAVFANSLMGTFDVRYNSTVLAPPPMVIGQGFNFDGNNARHQLIFNTELPLVRQIERNNYRASLIAYQRQRRNLQAVQDTILLQVRARVRRLQQLEATYTIQQRALLLIYSQVNQSREQLQAPPEPGVTRDTASAAGTATLQLLQAQRGVPQAQSNLYTTWINYLIARMELYRDLELMQIDSRGVWIDDTASTASKPAPPR